MASTRAASLRVMEVAMRIGMCLPPARPISSLQMATRSARMSVPAKRQAPKQVPNAAASFSQYDDIVPPTANQTVLQWSSQFYETITKLEQPQREPQTVLGDTPTGRKLLVQDLDSEQAGSWRQHVLDTWFS